MGKKYFFFDIDGTIVPSSGGHQVPENTRQALDQLKANGHFCAIATGRAQCLAIDQCIELGFDHMISDGGNGITLDHKLVSLDPMPKEPCLKLIQECEKLGFPWAVSPENTRLRLTPSQKFADEADNAYQRSKVIPDLDPQTLLQILKMFVACHPGDEKRLPALSALPWIRYQEEYIYIEPMDKSVGIRKLQELFQIPNEDVVVFGDGKNDISMFRPEWTSIAMGNAIPELKSRADFITRNTDDDGIGHALRHFGWI